MSKDELRPCVVACIEETEIEEFFSGRKRITTIKRGKPRKAFFHTWCVNTIGNFNGVEALVEYENGSMGFVRPENIAFTDRN